MSEELSRKLNYQFQQPNLLRMALTHRSSKGDEHNERLEFLGDSVVNFIIAEVLYHKFPRATEGELSRWRASLVNRDALGELARQFNLGHYIHLGGGEKKSGGSERHSILSCTMEAVIGAVYLDGGFAVAKDCIEKWYAPLLHSLSSAAEHKDPKTQLQEFAQCYRMALPLYTIDKIEGESHKQIFTVICKIADVETTATGQGTSRRRAEQDSARHMLGLLKK